MSPLLPAGGPPPAQHAEEAVPISLGCLEARAAGHRGNGGHSGRHGAADGIPARARMRWRGHGEEGPRGQALGSSAAGGEAGRCRQGSALPA
jgi:hypothetical protein